jgi:hypothetical protein
MIEAQREQALKEKLSQSSKMIWVTFRKEGIHKYPAALTDPKLATGDEYDVAIEVFHDDRDIEFIQFKRWLEKLYVEKTLALDYKSCEMISDDLYLAIIERYPGRKVTIEVSEDGENGSKAEYPRS